MTYSAPTVTGGAQPVQTNCTPASGQSFSLGTTAVMCTATDASSRSATCSFNVVLKGFSIAVTRYGAYGDSLTEGENGLPGSAGYMPFFVDTPNSYPVKLQQAFDAQYPGQGIVVISHGVGGELAEVTAAKIEGYLAVDMPGAVLLLSGYNNLLSGGCAYNDPPSGKCNDAVTAVKFGVRDSIRESKTPPNGVTYVFVSTLTPPGPYLGGVDRRIKGDAIVQANAALRQVIAQEGATLVDTYPRFLGHEAEYVDSDGLHLRPAGYQAVADAFFSVITASVPQAPLAAGRVRLNP